MSIDKLSKIERLIATINQLGSVGYNVNWMGAASDERILKAEMALDVVFPISYKKFLSLVGGGGLENFLILGVPAKGNIENLGSAVGATKYWRQRPDEHPLTEKLVVIQQDDDHNEPFCIDTAKMKKGECPVVLYYPWTGKSDYIADNFFQFLEKYLLPYFPSEKAKRE